MAECFERGPLSFLCWEDAFPQQAWERRRKMNLQKAAESKPATLPPPSEPVTSNIRRASNLVAQQSPQLPEFGQGCSAFKRYSPSLSTVSSEGSYSNVSGSNTSRRSPRSVTGRSSEGSLNGSGSNTPRRSPRSVTGKSSEGSLNGSASRIYSQSPRSSISKGSPCSINGTHEDLNENTKREISDPAIEQSVNEVSHYTHVGEYISQKYEKQQMCDISFKLGDKLFPAHKLVLASQSPLFAEVFEREHFSKEPVAPKIINVRGVSEEALVSFLAFIYTGRLDFNTVYWRDVMKLALVFKVEQIRKLYLRKIEQMKCEDQLRLLPNMAQLQAVEISDKIIRNISTNFLKIKECPAFFDLDVETLCLILSDENIMVRSEFDIFSAAVSWFQHHDYEKRVQHLETIMRCIRFPLMTNKELFLCLRKFPILRQNQSCVNMITMANWARTSLELNEEDPLDVPVNKRDGVNSPQSVSDYLKAKSSNSIEDEVEVEVTPMSQELAQDFNCHAGSPCMLLEQSPKVEQYRTSKCEATTQMKDSRSGNKRSPKKKGRKIPENSPIWQLQSMRF
ncbi:kelch-like protein 1 isoform X4 [Saccostrea cucullata]|uniref:kelch-like protein 1 isoform X4 n=1 Tax=Saccostrea cuccullata TaxID=36930 RepID=UPI002ED09911